MNPLLQDVELLFKGSIYVKEIKAPTLNDQLHFHNVHEIAWILKGSGKRIVGDNIEYFTNDDLVFISPMLPHASYIGQDYLLCNQEVHALVIYFHPDWFNESVTNSSDFVKLRKLMKDIERGIKVSGEARAKTIKSLMNLKKGKGLERIIILLEILDCISKSDDYKCLASEGYSNSYGKNDVERLGEVYKYIMKNFTDIIKLDDIASIANMTSTSFCKYFKYKTGKTFSSFVNEVRIGQACKMILNESLDISQICYSCGFNNLTNFNRNFKHFTRMTPTEYKRNLYGRI
ncbi:MAG: AraC family transcriptional regulator [Bacteroidota bacterium]